MTRPVFYPELGEFFRTLREDRKLGLRQAAQIAGNKGLLALTKSALHGLEKGKTKNVDPDVLDALAKLYDIPYADLVVRFVTVRYKIKGSSDLIRHAGTGQRTSHQGEADVPAEARERIAGLERRLAKSEALLDQVQAVAGSLARIIASREEVRPSRSTKSKTGGRNRKAS